jgi:hypothetical protein
MYHNLYHTIPDHVTPYQSSAPSTSQQRRSFVRYWSDLLLLPFVCITWEFWQASFPRLVVHVEDICHLWMLSTTWEWSPCINTDHFPFSYRLSVNVIIATGIACILLLPSRDSSPSNDCLILDNQTSDCVCGKSVLVGTSSDQVRTWHKWSD